MQEDTNMMTTEEVKPGSRDVLNCRRWRMVGRCADLSIRTMGLIVVSREE